MVNNLYYPVVMVKTGLVSERSLHQSLVDVRFFSLFSRYKYHGWLCTLRDGADVGKLWGLQRGEDLDNSWPNPRLIKLVLISGMD